MNDSAVKVKMTLKRADVKVNGEASRPAAAAAVEAVEARWREENKRQRAAERAKSFKGCLSWLVLLVAIPGAAWYFAGDKVLPPEWTFPQVYERISRFLNSGKAEEKIDPNSGKAEEKIDPADAATAAQRAKMTTAIKDLEGLCWAKPPVQEKLGYVDKLKVSAGRSFFESVIIADRNYQDACDKKAKMNAKNEKLDLKRGSEGAYGGRKYLAQYSSKELARQEMRLKETLAACATARLKCVKRTYMAVKGDSAKWTGPQSRADAEKMLGQLEALYDELLAKIKKDHPDAIVGNMPVRIGDKR